MLDMIIDTILEFLARPGVWQGVVAFAVTAWRAQAHGESRRARHMRIIQGCLKQAVSNTYREFSREAKLSHPSKKMGSPAMRQAMSKATVRLKDLVADRGINLTKHIAASEIEAHIEATISAQKGGAK